MTNPFPCEPHSELLVTIPHSLAHKTLSLHDYVAWQKYGQAAWDASTNFVGMFALLAVLDREQAIALGLALTQHAAHDLGRDRDETCNAFLAAVLDAVAPFDPRPLLRRTPLSQCPGDKIGIVHSILCLVDLKTVAPERVATYAEEFALSCYRDNMLRIVRGANQSVLSHVVRCVLPRPEVKP